MDDIKFIRFDAGDEIIGIVKNVDGVTTIENPVRIGITPDGNLAMVKLCPFSNDKEISINDSHILFMCNPVDEIKNIYNEKYGSGIIEVNHELIL